VREFHPQPVQGDDPRVRAEIDLRASRSMKANGSPSAMSSRSSGVIQAGRIGGEKFMRWTARLLRQQPQQPGGGVESVVEAKPVIGMNEMAGHFAAQQRAGFAHLGLISEWPVFHKIGCPPSRSINGSGARNI
jgi:hypothetical protein